MGTRTDTFQQSGPFSSKYKTNHFGTCLAQKNDDDFQEKRRTNGRFTAIPKSVVVRMIPSETGRIPCRVFAQARMTLKLTTMTTQMFMAARRITVEQYEEQEEEDKNNSNKIAYLLRHLRVLNSFNQQVKVRQRPTSARAPPRFP